MRFINILAFSVLAIFGTNATTAQVKATQPAYYEVADMLTVEQHLSKLDQWLTIQSLSAEQLAVVDAIKAYKAQELEEGLDSLRVILEATKLPEAHYWAGRIYGQQASEASMFKAGDLAESALIHFQRSVELESTFLEGHKALVQYYIRAPFFAGGSIKKAQQTAENIRKVDSIEGTLAHMQIASSEEDDKAMSKYLTELNDALKQQISLEAVDKDNHKLAGYFFTAAMTHMQAENYALSHENLSTALKLSQLSQAQYSKDPNDGSQSILQAVQASSLGNLRQGIRYQIGRLGVISEQNFDVSIQALNDFLMGPAHPSYEAHWANLRLAQLLQMDSQIAKAKEIMQLLPDVDNSQYSKLKKKLKRKLK